MEPENDPSKAVEVPEGQQPAGEGNGEGSGKPEVNTPTEFVEFEGVKVPTEAFEKIAKERYKDQFKSHEDRENWQKANTQKAQELAEDRRVAEQFRRLSADPRFQEFMNQGAPRPRNDFEAQKQAYVAKKVKTFPDVDPRFFSDQFEDMWEMSGARAQSQVTPLLRQQSEQWEAQYLKEHPLVQRGSEKYHQLAELVGKGYDPEHAYNLVYKDELVNQTVEERLKARDAEAMKKLQRKPTPSSSGGQKKTTSDEAFEKAWSKHGDN